MPPFSISENILMFYYENLSAALPFYEKTLGLTKTYNKDWVKIYQLTAASSIGLIQDPGGYSIEFFQWLEVEN